MKLEEAIEILQKEEEDTWMGEEEKWKTAVKLGYEALKRVADFRANGYFYFGGLLPGETKE